MSRQSKQRRTLALVKRFSAMRKAGTRTHDGLSRRMTSKEYVAKPHAAKPSTKIKVTYK